MAVHLSPYRLSKARESFQYFNIFNAVSWNLLVGIIITLFALRLGASPTYIGFLSATFYISLFLLPVGKLLARRFSIIGIYSFGWIARSFCMILAVAAPFVDYAGYRNLALLLIMLGVLLFHLFRGVGMIGNNPVLSLLATGPDRGSYMTQIQIINSAIGMLGSFLVAMILGMEPPIFIFSILLSAGVITGIISGVMIKEVPEPDRVKDGGMKLKEIFKEALSQDYLKHFLIIFFLVVLVSGVTRTFIIVYAREVLGHNDGLISLYSVFGGFGFLVAGMLIKFLVDRIGAKPLFIVCFVLGIVSLIILIFFPLSSFENVAPSILFMIFLFFMLNFGFLGSEGIAQTYFLGLVPSDKMLDMGILYFFVLGFAGASGTFLSGLIIDLLLFIGLSPFVSYKILFIIMLALSVLAVANQRKMKPLGSLPMSDALEVIFSFRDLRAISLLDRLNKAKDSDEEKTLLTELHNNPSNLAIDQLLERARSPMLATRQESIRALEKMDYIGENAELALIEDIKNNPYTTAYISARLLGKHKCLAAVPKLRELAFSGDYMLAGESVIALAKMNDAKFRPNIEELILSSDNPRLRIMGSEALGIFHDPESVPVLLNILRDKNQPPYLRDEVILSVAAIIDNKKKFYNILAKYLKDNSLAVTLAFDEVESTHEFIKNALNKKKASNETISLISAYAGKLNHAVTGYANEKKGDKLSQWITDIPREYSKASGNLRSIICRSVIDDELNDIDCLRLLFIHWAAQELKIIAAKIK